MLPGPYLAPRGKIEVQSLCEVDRPLSQMLCNSMYADFEVDVIQGMGRCGS